MQAIQRSDIIDAAQYRHQWRDRRDDIIELKRARRFRLSPYLSVVFESRETLVHQLNEVIRIENITDEAKIERELALYNHLVPASDELLITLFFEFTAQEQIHTHLDGVSSLDDRVALRVADYTLSAHVARAPGDPAVAAVNYVHLAVPALQQFLLSVRGCDVELTLSLPSQRYRVSLPMYIRDLLASELVAERDCSIFAHSSAA
ncbi:MAG: hypothetical protein Tsb0020_05190 [Haliangiales bacterium]